MKGEYGFGIIGTGAVAAIHAEAIGSLSGARLVACCARSPEKAARFASERGIKDYSDIKAFLADSEVDIVVVATPSGAHLDPSLAAIRAKKKAVIVEKPLEITAERCAALVREAEERGVMLAGVFQSRFCEGARILKKAAVEGRFGRIVLVDAQIKWLRPQEYYDSAAWRGTWKLDGGGALMNQGIHAIDLLRWIGGPVRDVSARAATLAHERVETEDTAAAVLSFESGAIGVIEGSTAAYPGFLKRIEVCGSEGSAILEEESIKFWQFRNERPEDADIRAKYSGAASFAGGASNPAAIGCAGHARQFADVMAALDEGREPEITGREASKAVELVEAIYKSARTGEAVRLVKK